MLSKKPFWTSAPLLLFWAGTALAEPAPASEWIAQKCQYYTEAWAWVLASQDLSGTSSRFLTEHQRFIDASCDQAIEICPETEADHALADLLTILSMNEGMASTFVPFACP